MSLSISTPAFREGELIPEEFTADGKDVSPALAWKGVPEAAQSLALIMDDPDAPPGTWVHWVLYNLPPKLTSLEENLPKTETLPNGAKQGACWGVSEFSRVGYFGPEPPPGPVHRYYFKLYALDRMLNLPAKASKFDVEKAMRGHILAQAQVMGKYGR